MVHGLSWIGWLPKLLHVKLCVSWFELKWTAAFNHSLAMYHVVLAERKLTSYVYAVVYVCMASKLPLVVPIHIKLGLVYNLIMMAFKEGLKVRYSSKYLSYEAVQGQPCIQPFMHLETLSWAGQVFHNTMMRLANHSAMSDALWFQLGEDLGRFSINEFCLITGLSCMSNAKFDNDDDAVRLSLLYIMFFIPLSDASAVKIDPKFFALVDDLDAFNAFPWGVLSWEATRAAICHTVDNRMSSKRRPLKKIYKVHYNLPGFPHALLVWAYDILPSIASKFTTKYEQAIPRMMSWTTAKNVKYDDVVAAFTTVGEFQLKGFVLMPTEEELKNPWVARLFLKNPTSMPQLPPPKSSVPRLSTDTNSEWREFQTEIRGQVASLNKKLEDLKREQKQSNKLLRRVLKMLSANIIEKREGKAEPAPPVSSIHEINTERVELDAIKTTSPDIGSVADIGVQAVMEFLTTDKQVDERERIPEGEGMRDPGIQTKDEKVEEEIILEQDFIKVVEPGNDESSDMKKRARLSRLGQRPARPMTNVGSPSTAPTKQPNALPSGLADEPPKETLEEFREWIKKGLLKRPPPGKKIRQYPELEQRKVTTVDTFFGVKVRGLWSVYQRSPEIFDWDSCDSIFRLMLGIQVQSGSSWFEVNTLLIPIHFADLKHWALIKLEITNWTIEVYDLQQHEGPHNSKVRGGVEALSKFIPLLAERLSLFEFKPREPPRTYPIPVTIMTDISRQGNGGDCGIFTIKNAECLIEERDVRYWVIQERMQIFREWMACYLWGHARRKLESQYKSDDDVDMGF
ncbi:hypothetical protein TIFTF001_037655 [Ficus carica]|uniref:Ubiquitin-like protease family profile domain-containing protein n=2 Tax=Ficus carica TaxID=3494 RepID=A0AA88JC22_FICCA|nr:hypothetical protein TIFTF001_037655 [Ficus carica]